MTLSHPFKTFTVLKSLALIMLFIVGCSNNDGLPQQADPDFVPKNKSKAFSQDNAPVVFIDEAHHNFHTSTGRYKPFVQVLESAGYNVIANDSIFSLESLKGVDVLVVSNPLNAKNYMDWTPPFLPAFTSEEVAAVKQWVIEGGSLLLIADHTPFPKAAETLASAFGFKLYDGHVGETIFKSDGKGISKHEITEVTDLYPAITQITSLGGSAFEIPESAQSLLTFTKPTKYLMPEKPFKITPDTKRLQAQGWSQGAVMESGKGRVAVFGEAAMFTSQVYVPTGEVLGLTSKGAEQNERFLLSVMLWLSNR